MQASPPTKKEPSAKASGSTLPIARFLLTFKTVWTLCAAALIFTVFCMTSTLAHAQLAYFSDYFSFVGEDEQGKVAFALDTNRGQDGEDFQAEHFLVLHDGKKGWVKLEGNGAYPNTEKALQALPDSNHFQFEGQPETGMRITGSTNELTLVVEALPTLLERRNGKNDYRMGAAAAVLKWQGRSLSGRVIYEFVHFDNWNRLTRTYYGFWKDFHGLYLMAQSKDPGPPGDFYIHTQKSEKLAPLIGKVDGFATLGGKTLPLSEAEIETTASDFALGFYRWPRGWRGRLPNTAPSLSFVMRMAEKQNLANWVIGGFAMGIVTGEVQLEGKTYSLYGIGEIIK